MRSGTRSLSIAYCAAACCAVALVGCDDSRPDTPGSGLRTVLGSGEASGGFATADRVIAFSFPQDHGAHPRFRSEWWYLTAVLADAAGREFGVQFTLFRQGLAPRPAQAPATSAAAWRSGQVYMAHVAVADLAKARHWHEERVARGHPALAGVQAQPFKAHLEGWQLASTGSGFWPLRLQADAKRFAFDLTLTSTKPIVPQGEDGLSRKGPRNASYYYSIPRIDASGRVVVDGVDHTVDGSAWLDREWSTSVLAAEYAGWDWFALALEDGRDVMLYQLRRRDGAADAYDSGTLVEADGAYRRLAADDFSLTVARRWRRWPTAWRLTVKGEGETWRVRAAFADQVMATSVRYWEGVVFVENADGERLGKGYMELTGY